MKKSETYFLSFLILFFICAGVVFSVGEAEKCYYAAEIKGVPCGFSEVSISSVEKDGKKYTLLEEKRLVKQSILGGAFDTEIEQEYHVDPETGKFFYYDSNIRFGTTRMGSTIKIEGDIAHYTSKMGGKPRSIRLIPGIILEQPQSFPHLMRDFVDNRKEKEIYDVLDLMKGEIHRKTYTKKGTEKLELAGKDYNAIVLDELNLKTGVKSKLWLNVEDGNILKLVLPNVTIYLADSTVCGKLKTADLENILFARVDVVIKDILSISYMKVKGSISSAGEWITAESLNVPGQSFKGTVKDNFIEGIFEIRHEKYDGSNAPPFPPDFSNDKSLQKYLEPENLMESDDPVLIKKARELTAGSKDSWEAACRLSRWVADEIGYDIPGGTSARNTYDKRLGECGSHSRLLTAFCRAVGIPARLAVGCMYTPGYGGSFGQHVWNEIYMGEAGWIPVDSTAHEIDYVDSGHIRLGTETSFNPKKMEILDYKTGFPGKVATEIEIPGKYQPYVGEYIANFDRFKNTIFKVLVHDGNLAVDIPGQMIFQLNEPDEEGKWVFKISNFINVSFHRNSAGKVSHMNLNQATPLPRKDQDAPVDDNNIPEKFRPYPGRYSVPMENRELIVLFQDDNLAINDPRSGIVKLKGPDKEGKWTEQFTKKKISFAFDEAGNVRMMLIHHSFRIPRKGVNGQLTTWKIVLLVLFFGFLIFLGIKMFRSAPDRNE